LAASASAAGVLLMTDGLLNPEKKILAACTPAPLPANRGTLACHEKHMIGDTKTILPFNITARTDQEHIHAESFSREMDEIAGQVDFRGMMANACFLTRGASDCVIEQLAFGLKVFAPKGTVLIEEGSKNSSVYIVGHGQLSVTRHGQKLTHAGPGETVGFLGMVGKTSAQPRVTVESDTAYLLILEHEHYHAIIDKSPVLLKNVQFLVDECYGQIRGADHEMLDRGVGSDSDLKKESSVAAFSS